MPSLWPSPLLRLLGAASLLVAVTAVGPVASAATCALSAGNLGIGVGDGEDVVLLNDGTTIDVQGASGCATAISSITNGISVSGTSGDNAVEVRLHATVGYPVIAFALLGGTDTVLVTGTAGNDTLNLATRFSGPSGISTFTVDGGGGADTITAAGWGGAVRLLGGAGDDTLVGTTFADTIDGGPNDDTIAGRGGADALEGGLGTGDAADYSGSGSAVAVTVNAVSTANTGGDAGGDALSGFEDLIGSAFADTLVGDANGNALLGNAGDDVLVGRGGSDLLAGGSGADAASYAGSPVAVRVALGVGATGGDATGDQLAGVEDLIGSAFADRLSGDALANRLEGGPGNDTLVAGAGNDALLGGPGNDYLDGGLGADLASFQGAGRSVVADLTTGKATGDGADTLKGIEYLTGGSKGDTLVGDARANVLAGGGGPDTISGNGGNDRLLGLGGVDRLSGGSGADVIDGGKGTDICDGGPDLDTYKACDGTGTP